MAGPLPPLPCPLWKVSSLPALSLTSLFLAYTPVSALHVSCPQATSQSLYLKHISHPLHLSKSYLCPQDTSQILFLMSNHSMIFKKNINQILCLKAIMAVIAFSTRLRALHPHTCPARQPAWLSLPGGTCCCFGSGFPSSPRVQLCLNSPVGV